jgi:hypothetical protein
VVTGVFDFYPGDKSIGVLLSGIGWQMDLKADICHRLQIVQCPIAEQVNFHLNVGCLGLHAFAQRFSVSIGKTAVFNGIGGFFDVVVEADEFGLDAVFVFDAAMIVYV